MTHENQIRRVRGAILEDEYLITPEYQLLEQRFTALLEKRREDLAQGKHRNIRGIVMVGRSGSGKTSAIRQLFASVPHELMVEVPDAKCEVISVLTPSPSTLKTVGLAILSALGYPLTANRSASFIWEQVKTHLKLRGVLFLHLDEAQDLARHQTDNERQAVVNTLKSLMENSVWPVGVILTGTPELMAIINKDRQLSRRLRPVRLESLRREADAAPVLELVAAYAEKAELTLAEELTEMDFAHRLIHAADREFGIVIEFILMAIEALDPASKDLTIAEFAEAYSIRTGAIDGLNPFLARGYERIDVRRLLDDDTEAAL